MSDDDLNEIKILKQRLDELEKRSIMNSEDSPKSSPKSSPREDSMPSKNNSPKSSPREDSMPSKRNSPRYSFPSNISSDSSDDEKESVKKISSPTLSISSNSSAENENLKEASVSLNKSVMASNHYKKENTGMFFEGDYIKIYTISGNEKIFIIIPQDCPLTVKEKLSTPNSRTFQYIIPSDMNAIELNKNFYIIDTPFYRQNKSLFENLI